MKTYNTKLGKWLALIRLQSTPVTVVSLLLGYFTVNQTLDRHILPLIIVGALGHWGFYALNDAEDVTVDMGQGKSMKPLVSGDISVYKAEVVSYLLIGLSILGAVLWFNSFAATAYLLAAVCGWYYDLHSSEHTYSAFYLGAWGVIIIWTGALYAQGWSIYTILLSLLLGTHMVWMTVIGDLKDVENTEPNLVHKYDCHVTKFYWAHGRNIGEPRLFKSLRFQTIVVFPLLMLQIILSYSIVIYNLFQNSFSLMSLGIVLLVLFFSYLFFASGATIGNNEPYSEEKTTEDIITNEVVAVLMMLIASFSFLSPEVLVILTVSSVVFGLSVLRIQFGSFSTFP